MTNKEKYDQAFTEGLEIDGTNLEDLKYQAIPEWDSVGHMGLIAALEDAFDIMMDKDGELYALEANTLPGMTPMSLMPQEAAAVGINYNQLCEKLVKMALEK